MQHCYYNNAYGWVLSTTFLDFFWTFFNNFLARILAIAGGAVLGEQLYEFGLGFLGVGRFAFP